MEAGVAILCMRKGCQHPAEECFTVDLEFDGGGKEGVEISLCMSCRLEFQSILGKREDAEFRIVTKEKELLFDNKGTVVHLDRETHLIS
jgi:hypothetical protein